MELAQDAPPDDWQPQDSAPGFSPRQVASAQAFNHWLNQLRSVGGISIMVPALLLKPEFKP